MIGQRESNLLISLTDEYQIITIYKQKVMKIQLPIYEQQSPKVSKSSKPQLIPKSIVGPHMGVQQLKLKVNYDDQEDLYEVLQVLKILNYPDTILAEIHQGAMKLGYFDLKDSIDETSILGAKQLCECCGFFKQIKSIPLCTDITKIMNIGTSTLLYFQSYKYFAFLLSSLFIIYSIFAVVVNVISAQGGADQQANIDYLTISLGSIQLNQNNQSNLYYNIQCWLGLVVVVVWICIFIAITYYQQMNEISYDDNTTTNSDFSIAIEGMPMDVTLQELQKTFYSYQKYLESSTGTIIAKENFEIAKINIGKPYYLYQEELSNEEEDKIDKELQEIRDRICSWVLERQKQYSFSVLEQERFRLYKRYSLLLKQKKAINIDLAKRFRQKLRNAKQNELTVVFVTMKTSKASREIVKYNKSFFHQTVKELFSCGKNTKKFRFKREDLTIYPDINRAPQPEDVIWNNIGYLRDKVYLRKLSTFAITVAMLALTFVCVYFLSDAKNIYPENRALSISISVLLSVVNILLGILITQLTLFEKDYTKTNYQTSYAIKSIMAQLINNIVTPLICSRYIDNNLYSKNGLADNIFILALTNSFVPPIVLFITPPYIINRLFKWYKSQPENKLYQSQREMNQTFQLIQFEVGTQYIYLVSLYLFVCYYVSLQPVIAIIALLGIAFMYWVQKYYLLSKCKRPAAGNSLLNEGILKMAELGPIAYSIGALTWSIFFVEGGPKSTLVPSVLAAVLSALIFIIPIGPIIGTYFIGKQVQACNYYDKRIYFPTEYDRLNPDTQEEGIRDYKIYLEEKKRQAKKNDHDDQILQNIFNQLKSKELHEKRVQQNNMNALKNNLSYFIEDSKDLAVQSIVGELVKKKYTMSPNATMTKIKNNDSSTIFGMFLEKEASK